MPLINQPKKHHYVPECYLKRFAQSDDLYAINIQLARDGHHPSPRKVTPAQICYRDYYYRFKPESTNPMYALHDLKELEIETDTLRTWEHGYPAVWERIIQQRTISMDDAIAMAKFIIQMKIRNPAWERFNKQKGDSLYEQAEADLYKEVSTDSRWAHFPPEVIKALLAELKSRYLADADRAKQMQLSSLRYRARPGIEQNAAIKKGLVDGRWVMIDLTQQDACFVTTDNPGVAVDRNNVVHNSKFTGGAFFFFPLSSKHCLVISDINSDNAYSNNHPVKEISVLPYTNEDVARLNASLCEVCDTTLVSGVEAPLIALVASHQRKK